MDKFRWGIIATGNIAGSMAQSLNAAEDAELLAVASRDQERANAFGERWHIPRRYAGYETLAADPDIDIVYIATPHSNHFDNMKLCLNARKHVLCEKPLTLNAREAAECIELAQEKGLFLMEAVWMRFFPAIDQIRQWMNKGILGDIRLITADFCFQLPFDPHHRLYDPNLGGGALLDIGIYPLSFATMLLGFPEHHSSQVVLGETGIDELNAITLRYQSGAIAQLTSSMRIDKPREAFIVGSRGYIKVHDIFFRPDKLTLHLNGMPAKTIDKPYRVNGYIHEVEEVHACLRAGKVESDLMSHAETLKMMALMDQLRADWGVKYPSEKTTDLRNQTTE